MLGPTVTDAVVLAQLALFRRDYEEFGVRYQQAASPEEQRKIYSAENPIQQHVVKFEELARKSPKSRSAFEALVTVCRLTLNDSTPAAKVAFQKAVNCLVRDHMNEQSIGAVCWEFAASEDEQVRILQRKVFDSSKQNDTKVMAGLGLAMALRNDPRTRGRCEQECTAILEQLANEHPTYDFGGATLKELIAELLFNIQHLGVGCQAAEIVGKDSQGKEFRLSDLDGQVRLIDFWADWCPYCRRMYPHERLLQKKYDKKPFAILGVSCDELGRLKEVEAGQNVTWRSWADGPGGPIATQWKVSSYPTVALVDHLGLVRMRGNITGGRLDAAIHRLVLEKELSLSCDLVRPCSVWNYLDSGIAPAETWLSPRFDDSSWHSGRGPFGYEVTNEGAVEGEFGTYVRFGPNPRYKQITTYFRKEIDVPDPSKIRDALLALSCDDGAAVYLNGREVFRENLENAARHESLAEVETSNNGQSWIYVGIDPSLFRKGKNLIAAEVHQRAESDSDIRFDLTLSTNCTSRLAAVAADSDNLARGDALRALVEIGPSAATAIPNVKKAFTSDDPFVRALATATLLQLAPSWHATGKKLPAPKDPQEGQIRRTIASEFAARAFRFFVPKELTRFEYEKAHRYSKAAIALDPTLAGAHRVLGGAEYRVGNFQAAVDELKRDSDALPSRLAFLAMALERTGNHADAKETLAKLNVAMAWPKYRKSEAAQRLANEAKAVVNP